MYSAIGGEAVPEPRVLDDLAHDVAQIGMTAIHEHGGGTRALGVACVWIALAVIVRLAQRLPKGTPERRALAEAAVPLRDCLPD